MKWSLRKGTGCIRKSTKTSVKDKSHSRFLISSFLSGIIWKFFSFYKIQEPYATWNPTRVPRTWSDQGQQLIWTLMTWSKHNGNSDQHCLLQEQSTSCQLLHSCPSKEEFWEANKVASQNFMVTLFPKAQTHNGTHCEKTITEADCANRRQETASWQRMRDDKQ